MPKDKVTLLDWLCLANPPAFIIARPLGGFVGFLTVLVVTLVIGATLIQFLYHVTGLSQLDTDTTRHEAIRNIGLVLAGVIGAPFVMWRSWAAAKQVQVAEESLFNDKIATAAEDLGKRRQVTRTVTQKDNEVILTEWQDDRIARAAAIDRLEGLANERPEIAPRVARMLSVYVREMSHDFPAQDHPRYEWLRRIEGDDGPTQDAHQIHAETGISPEGASITSLQRWAQNLKPVRSDMERAAQTLGRLKRIPGIDPELIVIDLHDANLQGFDLSGLCFDKAVLEDARIEGSLLFGTRLEGANLYDACLEGANLNRAKLNRSDLSRARLTGATLIQATLEHVDLSGAWMERTLLLDTCLEGAMLQGARFIGADLREAQLEKAILVNSNFEGANLMGAKAGKQTVFRNAILWGAGLQHINLTHPSASKLELRESFGDGSVKLSSDTERPAHWPTETLDFPDFYDQWRAFQAEIGYTPPQ